MTDVLGVQVVSPPVVPVAPVVAPVAPSPAIPPSPTGPCQNVLQILQSNPQLSTWLSILQVKTHPHFYTFYHVPVKRMNAWEGKHHVWENDQCASHSSTGLRQQMSTHPQDVLIEISR